VNDDPLLARVRAADPARAGYRVPRPERVEAARRHRTRARLRLATAAGVGALALAAAVASVPGHSPVLVTAVRAAELPPRSIVVIESEVTARGGKTFTKRQTTWMLTSRTGGVAAWHLLVTKASDPALETEEAGGTGLLRQRDPKTGAVTTRRNVTGTPSTAFALTVRRRLEQARASGAHVRHADGYLAVDSTSSTGSLVQAYEVRLDPSSFAAIAYVSSDRGPGLTQQVQERVLRRTTLPDTPANRRLLELR
jgi:hypothetical protein